MDRPYVKLCLAGFAALPTQSLPSTDLDSFADLLLPGQGAYLVIDLVTDILLAIPILASAIAGCHLRNGLSVLHIVTHPILLIPRIDYC